MRPLDRLVRDLRADFATTSSGVRSYKATEDDIGEEFARAENYLSLVGLVIVILGGIGVSSVTRVFVQQKMKSIAVLKCVGAPLVAAARDLRGAGGGARSRRQPARRRPGARSRCAPSPRCSPASSPGVAIHYALTAPRGGARPRHRRAGVAAVLAGAVARGAARQAVAAAARRAAPTARDVTQIAVTCWWSPGWSASRCGRPARCVSA